MWKNLTLIGGRNPISMCVRRGGSLEEVSSLIDSMPDQLLKREKGGMLPLHAAASSNASLQVVELIATEWPKALRETDDEGRHALHLAARSAAALDVIQFLAKKHPQALTKKDCRGYLPLHVAAEKHPSLEVVTFLGEEYPEALLEEDNDGALPLHLAAHDAALDVVVYLASKEPKALRAKDRRGRVPLHNAAQHATLNVVEFLEGREPRAVKRKDNDGWLPLHLASSSNGVDVVQFLLDKFRLGATVRGYKGCVPLQHAASTGSLAVVKLLLKEYSEAARDKDDDGCLPLHNAAAYNSDLDVVQFLTLESPEALWEGGGKKGRLPLDLAQKNKRWETAAWLKTEMERVCPTSSSSSSTGGSSTSLGANQSYLPLADDQCAKTRSLDIFESMTVVENTAPVLPVTLPVVDAEGDRARVKSVVEMGVREPALVSQAYVESIRTGVLLGRGFFGTVYKGEDSTIGHDFAIKVINREILAGGSPMDVEGAMKSFRREQEALSRFRHPNIAALFAYSFPVDGTAGAYYLLYELAEKGSLDAFLTSDFGRSRLASFSRRVQIAVDVFTAIRFLHVGNDNISSCFHRDVKSANVVIKRNFTAQLIDCGIAKFVKDDDYDATSTGIKGTPGYLCPEYGAGGIPYGSACDIYSFGIVLTELWTGRVQNSRDESGSLLNFGKHYVLGKRGKKRDLKEDVDACLERTDDMASLPDCMTRYTDLALACMAHDMEDRPPGDQVLGELKAILQACSSLEEAGESLGAACRNEIQPHAGGELCSICRTMLVARPSKTCVMCLFLDKARSQWSKMLSQSLAPVKASLDRLCEQVEAANPVLARLDARLNHQIPRLFLLVPADSKSSDPENPLVWLRNKVQTRYYLFFICAVSKKAIYPPISFCVHKSWLDKISPLVVASLFLLQASLSSGLNLNVDLAGTAMRLHVTAKHISSMLRAVVSDDMMGTANSALLDRLRSNHLSMRDVQELSGEAYELVIEKALEQKGWRSNMEPVRVSPSPKVMWVSKEVAQNPMYEIIKL